MKNKKRTYNQKLKLLNQKTTSYKIGKWLNLIKPLKIIKDKTKCSRKAKHKKRLYEY